MLIISKVFDDNTAEILNVLTYEKRLFSEIDLIEIGKKEDVLGLSVNSSRNKINYINRIKGMYN